MSAPFDPPSPPAEFAERVRAEVEAADRGARELAGTPRREPRPEPEPEPAKPYVPGPRPKGRCAGCGVDWDDRTPGCRNCEVRHWQRDEEAKRTAGIVARELARTIDKGGAMTTFGPYPGKVLDVHDGDTLRIDLDLGFGVHQVELSARLFGINAPELATQAGKEALAFLLTLVAPGDRVTVRSHGFDKYGGRYDAEVATRQGVDLSKAMLDSGHARPFLASGRGSSLVADPAKEDAMTDSALPPPDQHAASEAAREANARREEAERLLSDGSTTIEELFAEVDAERERDLHLGEGDQHRHLGHMHLRAALLAVPHIGEVKADQIIEAAGLKGDQRLDDIGSRQQAHVVELVAQHQPQTG